MFCECDQNNFTLSRGDTFTFPVVINQGTRLDPEEYQLQPGDQIYVAIMEPNQSFEDAIIKKLINKDSLKNEHGNPLLKLTSEDTEFLRTGKYFITIKLKQYDNTVTTILPMKEFWIVGTTKTQVTSQKYEDPPIDLSDFVTNGELTSILTEYQPKGNYKTVQTAKNYTGTTVKTVTSLKQDTNGVITEIGFEDIAFPDAPDITITDGEAIETPSTATVNVYKNLTANGHTLTEELVEVATAKGVADALDAAKKYADANDTNTAHTHAAGLGIKVNGTENGGIDGEVKLDLNVKFLPELVTKTDNKKYLQLVDATDTTKLIAEFDTTEFIKDGMLKSVELSDGDTTHKDGPYLVFTWNIDNAISEDTDSNDDVLWVSVKDLVDTYSADNTSLELNNTTFSIKDSGVTTAKIADKAVTEAKLAEEVTTKLNKQWQPVGNYKTVQDAVSDPTASGNSLTFIDTISQNTNGVITATKKNVNLTDYALKTEIPTDFGVTKITSNDTTNSANDSNVSGLKITPADGTGTVNIEIDDTVTFTFDCGTSTTVI